MSREWTNWLLTNLPLVALVEYDMEMYVVETQRAADPRPK